MSRTTQSTIDIHMRATCRMIAGHFTAKALSREIGIHINTAYKLIREGQDQGLVRCIRTQRPPGLERGVVFVYEFRNPFVDMAPTSDVKLAPSNHQWRP